MTDVLAHPSIASSMDQFMDAEPFIVRTLSDWECGVRSRLAAVIGTVASTGDPIVQRLHKIGAIDSETSEETSNETSNQTLEETSAEATLANGAYNISRVFERTQRQTIEVTRTVAKHAYNTVLSAQETLRWIESTIDASEPPSNAYVLDAWHRAKDAYDRASDSFRIATLNNTENVLESELRLTSADEEHLRNLERIINNSSYAYPYGANDQQHHEDIKAIFGERPNVGEPDRE